MSGDIAMPNDYATKSDLLVISEQILALAQKVDLLNGNVCEKIMDNVTNMAKLDEKVKSIETKINAVEDEILVIKTNNAVSRRMMLTLFIIFGFVFTILSNLNNLHKLLESLTN